MDAEELARLEHILNTADENRKLLSDWERNFLDDTIKRYDEYKADTRVSAKQWAVLERIFEKC